MNKHIEIIQKYLIFIFLLLFCIAFSFAQPSDDKLSFFNLKKTGTLNDTFINTHKGAFKHADSQHLIVVGGVELSDFDALFSLLPDTNWNRKAIVCSKDENGEYRKVLDEELPFEPGAFGASVSFETGFFCIGGYVNNGFSKKVKFISWNETENKITSRDYPDLPVSLALGGAAIFQNKIYLTGGLSTNELKAGNYNLFILDLDLPDLGWETTPSPIQQTTLMPSLCIQGDGLNNCLYIFGGLDNQQVPIKNAFKLDLKTKEWEGLSTFFQNDQGYITTSQSQAIPVGNSSILIINTEERGAGSEKQGPSKPFFIFNTITHAYAPLGETEASIQTVIPGKQLEGYILLAKQKDQAYNIFKLRGFDQNDSFGGLDILVLILYFLVLVYIGFYYSSKQKTEDDYFKAGQRIPWWAAGLSLLGTGLSAITFMAVPAKAFATDWAYFLIRLPLIFIPFLIGYLYIPFFRNLKLTSVYEYLQKRFNLPTRLIASFSFILFQLGRIGVILFLPSVALNIATGFDILTCIVLMGIVSVIYTMLGGIEAVIWTDVMQVVLLMGGMLLCIIFISFKMENGLSEILEIGIHDNKFNILNLDFDFLEPSLWVVIIGGFFTHLVTYGSDQTMVQRYMTTKTNKDATKSLWTSIGISFGLGWIFFFMGTALYAYYQTYPLTLLPTMASNDAILPWYIISELPDGLSGLLIAGIFAAAMSSLSSSMNSAATAYTMDFHKLYRTEFNAVSVGRIVTLFIGLGGILFAILFATLNVKSIWDEFLKIIGLMTGGLGGVFLLGIITEKANGAGVLIGLLISAVVQYFVGVYQPFNLLLYTASGFISCFIAGYLFSLLLPLYNKPIEGLTIYSIKPEK